jgi:hypothetical protein
MDFIEEENSSGCWFLLHDLTITKEWWGSSLRLPFLPSLPSAFSNLENEGDTIG